MDAFNLDARVVTSAAPAGPLAPASISSFITRVACTKTPTCSKATCMCTVQGACTAGCRR